MRWAAFRVSGIAYTAALVWAATASCNVRASALTSPVTLTSPATQEGQASPVAAGVRTLGAIKAIDENKLTIRADDGSEVTALLRSDTRVVRVSPGEKDLKNAAPLRVEDLQVGDRVLVRGAPSAEPKSVQAISVIVMKQSDVTAKQEQQREDWQKRGVGGLVTAIDAAGGTITISTSAPGAASKTIAVHVTHSTVLRRYAPDSVKFEEAKLAPLDQIHVGDQLRARGTRSADGAEVSADEIVSGTFRNIAGRVAAVDASAKMLTVQDAITKKPVTVAIVGDSAIKKLPPEIAQRIAMRLRGGANGNGHAGAASGAQAGGASQGGMSGGEHAGPPDLQRFLSRLPSVSLADLQKGDAVMIVSTDGSGSGRVTAITLLAGVEPILAAPSGASSAILSPWTLAPSNAEATAP